MHFRLLHEKDKQPVSQRMVNPTTGKAVASEDVRRGFEVDDGVFVLLDDEELAELEPEPSRDVAVKHFVEPRAIAPQLYERPVLARPRRRPQRLFRAGRALAAKGDQGIVRWTMRKRRYVGALHSDGDHLMMTTLRFGDEVVLPAELTAPAGPELRAAERKMAEQLVAALEGPFDPEEFHDEFRERVLELVERKAKGGQRQARAAPSRRRAARSRSSGLSSSSLREMRKTA